MRAMNLRMMDSSLRAESQLASKRSKSKGGTGDGLWRALLQLGISKSVTELKMNDLRSSFSSFRWRRYHLIGIVLYFSLCTLKFSSRKSKGKAVSSGRRYSGDQHPSGAWTILLRGWGIALIVAAILQCSNGPVLYSLWTAWLS